MSSLVVFLDCAIVLNQAQWKLGGWNSVVRGMSLTGSVGFLNFCISISFVLIGVFYRWLLYTTACLWAYIGQASHLTRDLLSLVCVCE